MRRPRPVSMPAETRSTTSSNSSRVSRRYGQARVNRPNSSSSATPSSPLAAASATICWARMSSGCSGGWRASRRPALDRGQQRGAFDQLVPGGRVHDPRGDTGAVVVGPAHPLEEGGDAVGRADLAHQLDRPDVDAELERGGGHQGAQVAGPQAVLDPLAALPRQRSVMGGHLVLARAARPARGPPARTASWC